MARCWHKFCKPTRAAPTTRASSPHLHSLQTSFFSPPSPYFTPTIPSHKHNRTTGFFYAALFSAKSVLGGADLSFSFSAETANSYISSTKSISSYLSPYTPSHYKSLFPSSHPFPAQTFAKSISSHIAPYGTSLRKRLVVFDPYYKTLPKSFSSYSPSSYKPVFLSSPETSPSFPNPSFKTLFPSSPTNKAVAKKITARKKPKPRIYVKKRGCTIPPQIAHFPWAKYLCKTLKVRNLEKSIHPFA